MMKTTLTLRKVPSVVRVRTVTKDTPLTHLLKKLHAGQLAKTKVKMVNRLPNSLHWQHRLKPMFAFLFSLVFIYTSSQLTAQDVVSAVLTPTIQPADPMVGDSVCFDWKITNLTADTLCDVQIKTDTIVNGMTVANNVLVAMATTLLPNGQMTASGSSLTGSGSFMMTGSGCSFYTADDISKGYKLINANVMSMGGSMSAVSGKSIALKSTHECTPFSQDFTGIICDDELTLAMPSGNISLSGKCDAEVDADLIQLKLPVPEEFVRFTIIENDGSPRPQPILNADDVGTRVKIQIDIPGCPDVAPAWNSFLIEYKLAPQAVCSSDTISCAENVAMNEPIVTAGCGDTKFIRIRTGSRDLCSPTSEFLSVDTVIYAIQDQFGNVGDTCSQLRWIRKPNLTFESIDWPMDRTFYCDDDIFNADGELNDDIVPVPTWDGVRITTLSGTLCNVYAEVETLFDVRDNCERRITRQWTIYEWKCEGGVTTIPGPPVVITLIDTVPPVIAPLPDSLDFTVDNFECVATFFAPETTATDDCNNDQTTLEFRYLDTVLTNRFDVAVKLPIGVHDLEYIARDGCGNTSRDTITVTVVDNTAPVAICVKNLVVPISDTIVRIYADQIDNDSYDACGIDKIQIARMPNNYCMPEDTIFGDYVQYCCSDGGKEVPTILRVYDMSGNYNECMVMVRVTDKTPASIIGLPDIEVSCQYTFDSDSLNVFGMIEMNPTTSPGPINLPPSLLISSSANAFTSSSALMNGRIFDNCGASVEELTPEINIDSICRTGFVTRTFRVIDASNVTTVVTQRITITNDALNNPVFFTFVPGDTTIIPSSGMDIRDLAEVNPAQASGSGCARPYIGYRDQVFKTDSSVYCTKIVRTWEIIDWCKERAREDLIEEDSVQIIFVQDKDGPVVTLNNNISVPQPAAGDAIELNATATDNIVTNSRQLDWSFQVFRGSSTTALITKDITTRDFRSDNTAIARIEGLGVGTYRVVWTVVDVCDNPTTVTQNLTVTERDNREVVAILGKVNYAGSQSMDNVQVYLTEEEAVYTGAEMSITDVDGDYSFGTMPVGDSYFIDPKKNDDVLNGVSTLDMLVIQRHILGLKDLETSEQKIAADVNNDGSISAFDLLDMKKVILGRSLEFSKNDSWTFAYGEQNLDDVFTYNDQLMRRYRIEALTENMNVEFYGIKIGDVSGDAQGNSAIARPRSIHTAKLVYDINREAGITTIAIKAGENMYIDALQADWRLENVSDITLTSGLLNVTYDNVNLDRLESGSLPMSIVSDKTIVAKAGDILFSMTTSSYVNGLSLTEQLLNAEVYQGVDAKAMILEQAEDVSAILTVGQNTPNPWNAMTTIEAYVPAAGEVSLRVYDVHNRVIHTESRNVNKGLHVFTIDQDKVSDSGVYFYEIEAAGQRVHQKMLRVN